MDELLYDVYIDELLYACLCWIIMMLYDIAINDEYDMIDELIHECTHWWSIIWITCWWNITWRYVYMLMNYYMNAYAELTWWLYDVAIKWWILMGLCCWCCTLLLKLCVVVDVVRCCWCCTLCLF